MPNVTFLPSDIAVSVPRGTLLSEAAILAGIEELHLPCAGKGTCGRCLVEVVSGDVDVPGPDAAGKRLVLSCQTRVAEDVTLRIRAPRETTMRAVGTSHQLVDPKFLPGADALSPLYGARTLTVPSASIDAHYSDWLRLARTLAPERNGARVIAPLPVLRALAEVLRTEDGNVTVTVQEEDDSLRVLAVQPGAAAVEAYGLAIDIGTTTVAVELIDLQTGDLQAGRTSYNAQLRRGADVISRIDYARTPERQDELRALVLDTLNELIAALLEDTEVDAAQVRAAFIAGNTTMVHLLLGLPPRYIRESPYVPTVNPVPAISAAAVGLAIHPEAMVACAPGVGSYVGGDITAGLLCTELLTNREEVFLFLDIGTNGEIVLGNADWMVGCACSAGPAFEGSGIRCGMRAVDGAVEDVEISADLAQVTCRVIGDGPPAGVCGSGLISLLGTLLMCGVIDQAGRFHEELPTDRLVTLENNTRAFVLAWAAETRDGQDLLITEADIENLMRTKAAIYAACQLILANVGLEWEMISRVYIAGGFGRHIKIEDAVLIGMLPDLPPAQFQYIGNSSLTGAYIALLSAERRRALEDIAARMTYVDLSSDPRYMDSYMSALFLPHTDLHRFPSVQARLARG